jgi:hypothetical protein
MTDQGQPDDATDPAIGVSDPWGLDEQTVRALSAPTRRRVLDVLLGTDREWSLPELATVLTGWEVTVSGGMRTPADRRRIEVALHHRHLPQLDGANLVSYGSSTGTVTAKRVDAAVERRIRNVIDRETVD